MTTILDELEMLVAERDCFSRGDYSPEREAAENAVKSALFRSRHSLLAAARALATLKDACWFAGREGDLPMQVTLELLCAADEAFAPLLKEVGR